MDLVTATEAANLAGVSDRTLRKYVRSGRLSRVFDEAGRACYRIDELEGLESGSGAPVPEAERTGSGTGTAWTGSGTVRVRKRSRPEAESGESPSLNGHWHEVSPGAAGSFHTETRPEPYHRAELAEQKASLLESERDRLREDLDHARAQLDARVEEIQRRDQAERELRAVLARLEMTNSELASALVQKALPPAPEIIEVQPRRVRWWRLWSRE
jgi:DNA-binding transcriptional MerR regulator